MKKQIIISLLMAVFFLSGEAFAGNGMMEMNSSKTQRNSNMETQYMLPQHQMGHMMANTQVWDSTQQMSVAMNMMNNPAIIKMMGQMRGLNATARKQMLNNHKAMILELIKANNGGLCTASQQTSMINLMMNPQMIKLMSQMEGLSTNSRMNKLRQNASMMMRMMNGNNMYKGTQNNGMMRNMGGMNMGNSNMDSSKTHMANKNSIVRKGVINVEALDKNHDGKLYEDVMDWNVISDKPGTCPLCGMTLREMTVQQVKQNLKDHGFKFK